MAETGCSNLGTHPRVILFLICSCFRKPYSQSAITCSNLTPCSSVRITNFEQVNAEWVVILASKIHNFPRLSWRIFHKKGKEEEKKLFKKKKLLHWSFEVLQEQERSICIHCLKYWTKIRERKNEKEMVVFKECCLHSGWVVFSYPYFLGQFQPRCSYKVFFLRQKRF